MVEMAALRVDLIQILKKAQAVVLVMKNKTMKKVSFNLILFSAILSLASCSKERSPVTAWEYNEPKNGGFDVPAYEEQETGPGLVLIEGGTFTMGRAEQDVTYEWNAIPSRVSV